MSDTDAEATGSSPGQLVLAAVLLQVETLVTPLVPAAIRITLADTAFVRIALACLAFEIDLARSTGVL